MNEYKYKHNPYFGLKYFINRQKRGVSIHIIERDKSTLEAPLISNYHSFLVH